MVAKILLVFVVVAENNWLTLCGLRDAYRGQVLPNSLRHRVIRLLFLHRALAGVLRLLKLLLHFVLTFLASIVIRVVDGLINLLLWLFLVGSCCLRLFDHFFGSFLILLRFRGRAF